MSYLSLDEGPLHPVAVADTGTAELISDEPGEEPVLFGHLREETSQDAVPTARAHPGLGVGDPGRVRVCPHGAHYHDQGQEVPLLQCIDRRTEQFPKDPPTAPRS
jgi:hypothetical protein